MTAGLPAESNACRNKQHVIRQCADAISRAWISANAGNCSGIMLALEIPVRRCSHCELVEIPANHCAAH